MWACEAPVSLPRTKKSFSIVSNNQKPTLVKPGKMMTLNNQSWDECKAISNLHKKIYSLATSPNGNHILELPKTTPLLVTHESNNSTKILYIPLPTISPDNEENSRYRTCLIPEGDTILISNPFTQYSDMTYITRGQKKCVSDFVTSIETYAIADTGKILAVIIKNNIWIWQQIPDQFKGVGFWINLSEDQHFPVGLHTQDPNSPLIYKNIGVFDNPDEGRGCCFVTTVLPPSKPYDTIYIFNSICNFNNTCKPKFGKVSVTLPVLNGHSPPKLWWSPCCRILTVAVAKTLIMLTRDLDIISVLPLNEIFRTDDTEVAMIAWSSNLQLFVVTSMTGLIGAVTRSGKSLKHKVCHLKAFSEQQSPLGCNCDSVMPNVFCIYSRKHLRYLKIERSIFSHGIENIVSLPFPMKEISKLYPNVLDTIESLEHNIKPIDIVKLLYYSEIHHLFDYHSPLRYHVLKILENASKVLLDSGEHDVLTFFLVRGILRVTYVCIPAYDEIMNLLGNSILKRDQILLRIMEEEKNKNDWIVRKLDENNIIQMYDPTEEDFAEMVEFIPPNNNREADLQNVTHYTRNLLFDRDFDEYEECTIDISVIFDLLLELGKYDKALSLIKHPSIEADPVNVFKKILSTHAEDPLSIYRAMTLCLEKSSQHEIEIRTLCVKALLNLMKQKIADTTPSYSNKDEMAISELCMLEETIDLPVPQTVDECRDFGVIVSLAMCASEFKNLSYFYNGKSKNIPSELREQVREIFRMLWFVRWRHNAFQEAILTQLPGDCALRLLEFPEFIDTEKSLNMIKQCDITMFSEDVYQFYVIDKKSFEMDNEFIAFACEAAARITHSALERVSSAALELANNVDVDAPNSNILLTTVVSHMIPWVRTGILRKMVDLSCPEIIPNVLSEFEIFNFPPRPVPPPKIEPIDESDMLFAEEPIIDENELNSFEEEEHQEVEIRPVKQSELPFPEPRPDGELSEGEEDPKKGSKVKPENKKRKSKKKSLRKEREKRKRPHLRLINVDDPEPETKFPHLVPSFDPPNLQPYPMLNPNVSPDFHFQDSSYKPVLPPFLNAMHSEIHQPGQLFGPIWDIDPSLFERPYPKGIPNIPMCPPSPDEPIKIVNEPKLIIAEKKKNYGFSPPTKGRVERISSGSHHKEEPPFLYETSSLISDVPCDKNYGFNHETDPFKFDEDLRKRVDNLLNNPIDIYAPPLKPRPVYRGPDTS